jgi:hypothetical protein
VNGVRLHDVRGLLMVFPDEVDTFIREFVSSADPGKPRKP